MMIIIIIILVTCFFRAVSHLCLPRQSHVQSRGPAFASGKCDGSYVPRFDRQEFSWTSWGGGKPLFFCVTVSKDCIVLSFLAPSRGAKDGRQRKFFSPAFSFFRHRRSTRRPRDQGFPWFFGLGTPCPPKGPPNCTFPWCHQKISVLAHVPSNGISDSLRPLLHHDFYGVFDR